MPRGKRPVLNAVGCWCCGSSTVSKDELCEDCMQEMSGLEDGDAVSDLENNEDALEDYT